MDLHTQTQTNYYHQFDKEITGSVFFNTVDAVCVRADGYYLTTFATKTDRSLSNELQYDVGTKKERETERQCSVVDIIISCRL